MVWITKSDVCVKYEILFVSIERVNRENINDIKTDKYKMGIDMENLTHTRKNADPTL